MSNGENQDLLGSVLETMVRSRSNSIVNGSLWQGIGVRENAGRALWYAALYHLPVGFLEISTVVSSHDLCQMTRQIPQALCTQGTKLHLLYPAVVAQTVSAHMMKRNQASVHAIFYCPHQRGLFALPEALAHGYSL